jgi:hypothetical protein
MKLTFKRQELLAARQKFRVGQLVQRLIGKMPRKK